MKRLLALTLSALLLCPMTSFAAQTEEAKAVYQEMMDKSQTVNDINAYYDMILKMSGDALGESGSDSVEARIEMNARMQNLTNPAELRYQIFSRMSMPDEQPIEFSMYYLDGYYYMDMLGQKIKYPMPLEEALKEAMSTSRMFETSTDYFKDLTVRTEGDMRVLSFIIDDAVINEYVNTILSATGMDALYNGVSFSVSNVGGEYVINPDGYYTKAIMNMDMTITMMGETINASINADIGIADPGQPVDILTPNPNEYVEQSLN